MCLSTASRHMSFRLLPSDGLFPRYLIHHDGYRPVARHVAGGAEAIHRDIQGDHQRLQGLIESKHTLQYAQGRHNRPARNARRRDHRDTQHHNKPAEVRQQDRLSAHVQDSHRAGGDFHRATRQMDGSAERDGKNGDALAHAVLDGLRQRHRNGRRR